MRTLARGAFIELAATSGPLGSIVTASVMDGHVLPTLLKQNLEAAGYVVEVKPGHVGYYVKVFHGEDLIAQGYSNPEGDALLQAMYSAVKDESVAEAA